MSKRKRPEVFTTFGGGSTVVEILRAHSVERFRCPFLNFFLGRRVASAGILRARSYLERSVTLLGDVIIFSPVQEQRSWTRRNEERLSLHKRRPGKEEKNLRKCVAPRHRLVTNSIEHVDCLGRKAPAERIIQKVSKTFTRCLTSGR